MTSSFPDARQLELPVEWYAADKGSGVVRLRYRVESPEVGQKDAEHAEKEIVEIVDDAR